MLVTGDGVPGVSVAGAGASRAILSQPVVVRSSRRAWERPYVRAVVGIDAIASLVAGVTAYVVRWGPEEPYLR